MFEKCALLMICYDRSEHFENVPNQLKKCKCKTTKAEIIQSNRPQAFGFTALGQ